MCVTTDLRELDIMQLSDSFFPTGLFATSNGLESLFMSRKITTATQLMDFNRTCLEQQLGPGDCVALANAHEHCVSGSYEDIRKVDAVCSSIKAVKEAREASFRSGIQMVKCVREFQDDGILNWYHDEIQKKNVTGVYPVAFAVCCNALEISKENSLLMLLYGFVVSTVGAALRLGMIQHFEGQKIIHELKPLMVTVADKSSAKQIEDMWQFSPQIEISQMDHEEMDSKMFIT